MNCGKVKYENREAAKRAMKIINRQGTNHNILTDCYYCADCDGWHTTSLRKQRSRDYKRYLKKQNNS